MVEALNTFCHHINLLICEQAETIHFDGIELTREHKFTFYSQKASQSLTQSQVNKQDRKYQNKMIINMYEYVNI